MTTNSRSSIPADKNNRRYFVLNVKAPDNNSETYFNELYKAANEEVPEFLYFLLNMVTIPNNFNASATLQKMTPTPGAIEELFQGKQGTVFAWMRDRLSNKEWKVGEFLVVAKGGQSTKIFAEMVLDAFQYEIQSSTNLKKNGKLVDGVNFADESITNSTLTRNFNELFGEGVITIQTEGMVKRQVFTFPSLEILRTAFAKQSLNCEDYKWDI